MNRLAGTLFNGRPTLDAQGAAQVWAYGVKTSLATTTKGTSGWIPTRITLTDGGDYLHGVITDATVAATGQRVNTPTATKIPVTPGHTYTVKAMGRTNTAASVVTAIQFHDAGGVLIAGSFVVGADVPMNATTFTPASSVTVVAPPTAATTVASIGLSATGARSIGQFLDIQSGYLTDDTSGAQYPLDLVGCLNAIANTSGVELQGVLNILAGTQGLGVDEAASRIVA